MNKKIIASLLATSISAFCFQAQAAGEAKNVIFFLGDGMGPVVVTASRIYGYGEAGKLAMDTLPYAAKIRTYSADAQTTDSAPGMAGYMTGVRMKNNVISMTPETNPTSPSTDPAFPKSGSWINNCKTDGSNGKSVPTLLEQAIAKGKATGVVSTARITHATPAVNYAHVCNRNAEYEIAAQLTPGSKSYNTALGKGVDVILGGNSRYFVPVNAAGTTEQQAGRPDGSDLVGLMKSSGYTYVTNRNDLLAAPATTGSKLLGLFDQATDDVHMSYELDRNPALEPSIAEMTSKAIDVLSKNTNGYFLMVEGGRIDHALHGTNAARALTDTLAFDNAVKMALSKVDLSNTLVIVTADHDHTMAFNGYSKRGNNMLDVVTGTDNKPVLDSDGNAYTTLVFGQSPNRPKVRSNVTSDQAKSIGTYKAANVFNDGGGYFQEGVVKASAGGETHGSGDVMLFATGAAAQNFKGTMPNINVYNIIKTAFGL